jgi:hypothetical protein
MNNHLTPSSSFNLNPTDLKLKGFKVYEIESGANNAPSYNRRDFYKICLNTGKNIIHYADKSIPTDGTILFFANPLIPYSWEFVSPVYSGYACVFTEDFFKKNESLGNLQESPLFRSGGSPVIPLNEEKKDCVATIFQMMLTEQGSGYVFKDDLIRNYIELLIHQGINSLPGT